MLSPPLDARAVAWKHIFIFVPIHAWKRSMDDYQKKMVVQYIGGNLATRQLHDWITGVRQGRWYLAF